jgi:hypothetical protein
MSPPNIRDPFSHRFYRARWRVGGDISVTPDGGPQPLLLTYERKSQQDFYYPEFKTRRIALGDPVVRYSRRPEGCIYCGAKVYSSTRAALGEEHIIPEGIGGTLILLNASCNECEKRINVSESKMINTMFAAPRMHSGVSTRRPRQKEKQRLIVDGVEKEIFLPMREHPVMLTMAKLMAPRILCVRSAPESGIGGLWTKAFNFDPAALSAAERLHGVSDTFDALRFAHVLAKGHLEQCRFRRVIGYQCR